MPADTTTIAAIEAILGGVLLALAAVLFCMWLMGYLPW